MDRVLHSRFGLGKTPYSLSTKWGMGTSEVNAGATLRWTNRGTNWGVKILLVASRYRNQDRLEPGGPVGLYVGYLPISVMLWVPRHGLVLIS